MESTHSTLYEGSADGVIEYMLSLPGNENVMSINPVVGETNDGCLNSIRSRPVRQHHARQAMEKAISGKDGRFCEALPIERTLEICRKHGVME